MTDLMHLRVENNPFFWLDLTALQAFAWTGLALGFMSLVLVQRVVARRLGPHAVLVVCEANAQVIAYCAVLGAFLFTAYVVVHTWAGMREEP